MYMLGMYLNWIWIEQNKHYMESEWYIKFQE
jgi:hypothetical protein